LRNASRRRRAHRRVGAAWRRQRPDQSQRYHLVGQPGPPVRALGDAELLVQAQQVLLDRRLCHDQVSGDLPGRRWRDECLVGQRRAAQRSEHVGLAAGQLGCRLPAQLDFGRDALVHQRAHPAARRAEAEHVAVLEHAAGGGTAVDPGAVAR
jgi:hypothetical protein